MIVLNLFYERNRAVHSFVRHGGELGRGGGGGEGDIGGDDGQSNFAAVKCYFQHV